MKKRISGPLLILALIAPLAITFLTLQLQKHEIREETKQILLSETTPDHLTLIQFNSPEALSQLEWEDEHEFEYEGKMYDVVKMEKEGKTTRFWCLKDEKETALNQQLDDLVADLCGNSPQRKQQEKQVVEFLFKLYCHEPMAFAAPQPQSLSFAPFDLEQCTGIHSPPLVPPPQNGTSEIA